MPASNFAAISFACGMTGMASSRRDSLAAVARLSQLCVGQKFRTKKRAALSRSLPGKCS
jgi:hypothetical protein